MCPRRHWKPDLAGSEELRQQSMWRVPDEHVRGLLAGVFDSAPVGVAVIDRAGRVVAVNPALNLMSGWDEAAVLERPWQALLHPEDWAADAFLAGQAEAVPVRPMATTEVRLIRPDGTAVWIVLGVAVVNDATGRPRFTGPDGRPLYFLRLATDITEQKRVEAELATQAGRDALTGLPNRSALLSHLASQVRALSRGGGCVAILYFDLDRFKVVNDSLGHAAGDELLKIVAERVTAAFRPEDLVARLGGDEFVVTVTVRAHDPARDILSAAERVHEALRPPIGLRGRKVFATASIGIASTDDAHADPDVLLRDADAAMYVAKHREGPSYELFDSKLRAVVVDRLDLEHELREAINDDALTVAYQPIVRLRDEVVVAAEALARWQHPHRGQLLPDAFIPLAEETGLIGPLDRFVLRHACAHAAAWHRRHGRAAPMIRVNLSAHELTDAALIDDVTRCLDDTGLPPQQLCFEITETALVADPDAAATTIAELRALGVRFAVDDFGTRYASLAYLIRFPVDMVKIDRTFVAAVDTDPHHTAVVTAIISLASALNLTVTAEGVETRSQRDTLRHLGCRNGQGFLWAAPGDPDDVSALVSATSPH